MLLQRDSKSHVPAECRACYFTAVEETLSWKWCLTYPAQQLPEIHVVDLMSVLQAACGVRLSHQVEVMFQVTG